MHDILTHYQIVIIVIVVVITVIVSSSFYVLYFMSPSLSYVQYEITDSLKSGTVTELNTKFLSGKNSIQFNLLTSPVALHIH